MTGPPKSYKAIGSHNCIMHFHVSRLFYSHTGYPQTYFNQKSQKLVAHPVLSIKVCRNVWFLVKFTKYWKIWVDGVCIKMFRFWRFFFDFLRMKCFKIPISLRKHYLINSTPNLLGLPGKIAKIHQRLRVRIGVVISTSNCTSFLTCDAR